MTSALSRGWEVCAEPLRHLINLTAVGVLAWYGRSVALVFLPGIVTSMLIVNMTNRVGNRALGWFIACFIVAPATIPNVVPYAATAVGIVFSFTVLVVGRKIGQVFKRFLYLRMRPGNV